MRTIKFRAWDAEYKEFTHWDKIKKYRNLQKLMSLHHMKIMQYTGLADMNDKEIYEGDIVKLKYGIIPLTEILEVVWSNDYCSWWFKNICQDKHSGGAGMEYQDDIEIIGNIYQNPELLKKL